MKTKTKLLGMLMLLLFYMHAYSQSTMTGIGVAGHLGGVAGVDYLGWMVGTPIALDIRNDGTQNIDFYTGGFAAAFLRMTILGTAAANPGFVGIGTATPLTLLDILPPALNQAYGIGGVTVLQSWGTQNIYVGERAGFVAANTNTSFNAFVGYNAGSATNWASSAQPGSENAFVGAYAGFWNTDGSGNCAFGALSGVDNFSGVYNTFLGYSSGTSNVTSPIMNGTAIGFEALVPQSDQIILGRFPSGLSTTPTFVGIGLSADNNTTLGWRGPRDYLEINASTATYDQISSGTGASGLQFRQLNNQCTPQANSGNLGVLALDNNGKVIYVNDAGVTAAQNATWIDPNTGILEWGSGTTTPYTPLLHNTEVQMIDPSTNGEYNIYFTGQSAIGGNATPVDIGIGHPMNAGLLAKLDVMNYTFNSASFDYTNRYAGRFLQTGTYDVPPAPATQEFVGVWAKTDVSNMAGHTGLSAITNIGGDFYGLQADVNFGARGTANGFIAGEPGGNSQYDYGLSGEAKGPINTTGVRGFANLFLPPQHPMGGISTGVYGEADNGKAQNFGVWGIGHKVLGAFNVGVYGLAYLNGFAPTINYAVCGNLVGSPPNPCPIPPCPPMPAPVTWPDAAGYFNGDLVYTTSLYCASDASLKENIQNLKSPMEIINKLKPKSYLFNQKANPQMQLPVGLHYGLLAQEVEDVLPGLVKYCVHPAMYDSLGKNTSGVINYKAINYLELIPFLLAGIQQQQEQITNLERAIEELNLQGLQQNPNGDNGNVNSIDITLSSKTIVLNQNEPNPFKESTMIEYFIPDDATNVKIIFTDNKGSVLKEVEIAEKGKGQLNVYAADLSSGIYVYTIVANGINIDSKRMAKTK